MGPEPAKKEGDYSQPEAVAQRREGGDTSRDESMGSSALSATRQDVETGSQPVYVFRLRDLLEAPGELLPEETKTHLKNAGREAILAVYSLWRSITEAQREPKTRKHVDVE